MEKIDVHNSQHNYNKAIELLKKDIDSRNYNLITKYLDAASIGKTAQKKARKKVVGIRARMKYLYLLKSLVLYFKKDLSKLTEKDMEKFIKDINDDKFCKADGAAYSEHTKSNAKKALIKFLRYTLDNPKKHAQLTDWIETSFKRKEIPALTAEEIDKLINTCRTAYQRFLVTFLIDSGCRVEEFLNIRISDLVLVEADIPYYKVTVRNEFSKTAGRTFGLFRKETTTAIKEWLRVHPDPHNLETQLFPNTYGGIRRMLFKLGKRSIGKSVNPHLLRHTSCTLYASQLTHYQMCYRYGWTLSSSMPQQYIDKNGIGEKVLEEKYIGDNLTELNTKIEKMDQEKKITAEDISAIHAELAELRSKFSKIASR